MSIVPSARADLAGPSSGTIADVVGLILDKGLVIDVYVRVSLIGIEILTVDARVVVASVDTYLRFAEAAERLDLEAHARPGLPEVLAGVAGSGGLVGLINGANGGASGPARELAPAEEPAVVPLERAGRRRTGVRVPKREPAGTRPERGADR